MNPDSRPFLVFLRPGPCWAPEMLEFRLAKLFGEWYEGEIWSTGTPCDRQDPGELRVIFRSFEGPKALARARSWLGGLFRGIRLRFRVGGPMVLVCYDPFTTGTLGLLLKWLTGSHLIVEVNGIYGLDATFVDERGNALTRLKRWLMGVAGGTVLRNADAVKLLFPGQLRGLPVDEEALPTDVLFDSVDSDRFAKPPEVEQEDVILFVGHPFLLKGIDLLLEAFGRLKPEFPSWRLILIGFGLEGGARQAGIPVPRDTEFLGAQPHQVVEDWMERCKIFTLPSRSEAMGRVLLEAGLKGRARVVSRVGGMPHVVREDEDGLIFEPGDVDSLTLQLHRLMENPALRRQIEQQARETCLTNYTQEAYRRRYAELIGRTTGRIPVEAPRAS